MLSNTYYQCWVVKAMRANSVRRDTSLISWFELLGPKRVTGFGPGLWHRWVPDFGLQTHPEREHAKRRAK